MLPEAGWGRPTQDWVSGFCVWSGDYLNLGMWTPLSCATVPSQRGREGRKTNDHNTESQEAAPAVPTTAAAGTLTLGQAVSGSFNLSGFVPGVVTQQNSLTLTTGGSVSGNATFATTVVDTEDGCNGDEALVDDCPANTGDLSGKLQVTVTRSGFAPGQVYTGSVAGLVGSTNLNVANVPAGTGVTYTFVYNLPDSNTNVDNAVQGDSAVVTTTATLQS